MGLQKVVLILVALMCSGSAWSQSVDLPVVDKTFDISSIVKSLMPCYVIGRGEGGASLQLAGALYQLPWNFHDKSGTPFVEPTPGLVWSTSGDRNGQGGPIMAIGIRADNLYSRAISGQWVRDHYTSPKVPYVKLGPFGGYISRLGWLYGGFVALGIGGK